MQDITTTVSESVTLMNLSALGLFFLVIVLGTMVISVILILLLLRSRRSVVPYRAHPYPSTYNFHDQEIPKNVMNANFCPHCGSKNRLGSNFCASCGESIV
ncbi:MAG: zinc ribbon domain-containing protein [Candidatus Hermodarchaeota archaeon]